MVFNKLIERLLRVAYNNNLPATSLSLLDLWKINQSHIDSKIVLLSVVFRILIKLGLREGLKKSSKHLGFGAVRITEKFFREKWGK